MLRFGALGLVLIVSPSSKLGIKNLGIRFGRFSRFIESAEQAEKLKGVSWPCKSKRSNEGVVPMLMKEFRFGSHHRHARIIFGGDSEVSTMNFLYLQNFLTEFGIFTNGLEPVQPVQPWLAASVSHEKHLSFFVWFSLIRHHSWQPLYKEHLPFFVWFSLIRVALDFGIFEPLSMGLKPICYRALVSHLEDESSSICMTFGSLLPHFNHICLLAQALMLDFEYMFRVASSVNRVRVHKLATQLGIEPNLGFIRGSSLNLSWSRDIPFPFVGLLIEIDRGRYLRTGSRIDGHRAQLPIRGAPHDSTTPSPPPPPSGPSGPTIQRIT
ncbi:hypothetical protein AAG906_019006 [Vitis piasezkii]